VKLPFPIVVLDFETYFDKEYTLKKLTTEDYIRDPRFEAHGCAIRTADVVTGEVLTKWAEARHLHLPFGVIDWSKVAVLCHHAQFDGLILAHHYGIRPRMWLDTMAMARALLSSHLSVGLDPLAKMFGLSAKTVPYEAMKGKHWEDMDAGLRQQAACGCIHDVDLTWDIFQRLASQLPAEEFLLIDQTVRMFTEPALVGDTDRLSGLCTAEFERKENILAELGVSAKHLMSGAGFTKLLEREGVEVEYKDGKNGPIPAFAKTDTFMRNLCDDDDPRVSALAYARISQSSSIVETRCTRLRDMSRRGAMCVYLNYCGAHTKRFSGGDKVNWQNFPRNSNLGTAIEAPAGSVVVVSDASQIECRMLNTLAGQEDVIERFREGHDPYIGIASLFYGEKIYKAEKGDPRQAEMDAKRGTGKQLELSCGYGAGGQTIVATAKKGTYGPPVFLTEAQGVFARDLYRQTHQNVVSLWDDGGRILGMLAARQHIDCGVFEIKDKKIYGPNGLALDYSTLEWASWLKPDGTSETGWRVWVRNERTGHVHWTKMYGAKLIENIVQLLARTHTTQAWLRCAAAGMKIVSMEHDKLIAVVPESEGGAALMFMHQEMCRAPEWMSDVLLACEGYVSKTMKQSVRRDQ
jgi:3'-5' exonuclease